MNLHRLLFPIFLGLLSGCSSSLDAASKIGKILMDPSIPVGKAEERPSTMNLTLLSEKNINPNDEGDGSPLEIEIVYLTEDSKLLSLYYEKLESEELEDILGKNYIDHQSYTVLPEKYKVISNITLNEENRYLGVIAYYSAPEQAEWRKVIPLKGKAHAYNILIHMKEWGFEIKEYEE